jgi:hypothetical protein
MKLVIRDARVFIGGDDDDRDNDQMDGLESSSYTKKMFQKYRRWEQVETDFNKGIPLSLAVLRNGFVGAVIDDRDSWLMVPVSLTEFDKTVAGLHYFHVQLFERDQFTGLVTRNCINIGRSADFISFVLLLPCLPQQTNTAGHSTTTNATRRALSWTMMGAEYDRVSQDGTLQTVYHLPINLQSQQQYTIPINQHQQRIHDNEMESQEEDVMDESSFAAWI